MSHWAANSIVISWSTAGTPTPRLIILARSYFYLPVWERNTPISIALQLSCLDNWTLAADLPKRLPLISLESVLRPEALPISATLESFIPFGSGYKQ